MNGFASNGSWFYRLTTYGVVIFPFDRLSKNDFGIFCPILPFDKLRANGSIAFR